MRFFVLFYLIFCGVIAAPPQPVYKIAWQAPRGPDQVFAQFNKTFEYVGGEVAATFEIHPFTTDKEYLAAAGSFDFFFAGPTLIYCVILANNIQPLATLVSTVQGRPLGVLSGSIIVPSGRGLVTLSDIRRRIVATGQFTGFFVVRRFYLIQSADYPYSTQA